MFTRSVLTALMLKLSHSHPPTYTPTQQNPHDHSLIATQYQLMKSGPSAVSVQSVFHVFMPPVQFGLVWPVTLGVTGDEAFNTDLYCVQLNSARKELGTLST